MRYSMNDWEDQPIVHTPPCAGAGCTAIVRCFEDDDYDPSKPLLCEACAFTGNMPEGWGEDDDEWQEDEEKSGGYGYINDNGVYHDLAQYITEKYGLDALERSSESLLAVADDIDKENR